MAKHHSQRVNNRGSSYRISAGGKDRLQDEAEQLAASLGVSSWAEVEDEQPQPVVDSGFGALDVAVLVGMYAMGGMLNAFLF